MAKSKSEVWRELCDEWDPVWSELIEAQGELTAVFRKNGAPTDKQMDRADSARHAVEDLKARMDAFIKNER